MAEHGPYQVLPPLAADDYDRLKASIAERGVEVAIVVDEFGAILDGHHRSQIAKELGINCPRIVKSGLADFEKRLLSVTLNLARRQLTTAQKVLLGKQIEPDVAARAKKRMGEGGEKAAPGKPGPNVPGFPPEPQRARDEVARTVGLGSGRTYERATKLLDAVQEHAPELMPKVEAGELDLPEVRREIKKRVPESPIRREFLAAAQEAVRRAPQAAIDSWVELTTEAQALPITAEQFGKVLSALHRASLAFREIDAELLRQLADSDPNERDRLERAITLQTDMIARCRAAIGKRTPPLRRVV